MEEELKKLAQDIFMEWENRQTQTDFEKAVFTALATKFNWGNDHNNVMQFRVEARNPIIFYCGNIELIES